MTVCRSVTAASFWGHWGGVCRQLMIPPRPPPSGPSSSSPPITPNKSTSPRPLLLSSFHMPACMLSTPKHGYHSITAPYCNNPSHTHITLPSTTPFYRVAWPWRLCPVSIPYSPHIATHKHHHHHHITPSHHHIEEGKTSTTHKHIPNP